MPGPFEELCNVDRLVHEPARLAILTALSSCRSATFLFLEALTGMTKGNLSGHLSRLEKAELLVIEKRFRGRVPLTEVHLTDRGRETVARHWEQLDKLRKATRHWRPPIDTRPGMLAESFD